VPNRWIAGHVRVGDGEILWWRHNGLRRKALVFDASRLQLVREREVDRREYIYLSPTCKVLVCQLDGDEVELALLYDSDADDLRAVVGS
jgi:hypothetical protein